MVLSVFRNAVNIARRPLVVSLESSSRCNANCYMCERGKLDRSQTIMDFGLFQKAVDEANTAGVKVFQLSFYGECLLDPRLGEKLRYIRSTVPGAWTQIVTNGSLLTPERSRELLESGLSMIRISVDGNNAAEYEQIRPHLKYDKLLANIRTFRELRDANPAYQTVLSVAGLNLQRFPLDEAAYRAFWSRHADNVYVRNEHAIDLAGGETFLQKIVPCHKLFTVLPVLADGRHTACVFDWYADATCGDLKKESLREAWFSRRRTWYKVLHLLGLKKAVPVCRGCSYRPPIRNYVQKIVARAHA